MVKLPKHQRPLFVQEPWLDSALQELDTRSFSPEKYEAYARYMMRQAEEEREREEDAAKNKQQGEIQGVTKVIVGLLRKAAPLQYIAEAAEVDVQFVEKVKLKFGL